MSTATCSFTVSGRTLDDLHAQADAWLARLGGSWHYTLEVEPAVTTAAGAPEIWSANVRAETVCDS